MHAPLSSTRPYLIRAIYQWLVDNDLTPYLLVDARFPDVSVPQQYVQDGRIVLNLAPMAVHGLMLGNEEVSFSARFGGKPINVTVPIARVLAIYARENGQGLMLGESDEPISTDEPPTPLEEAASADAHAPNGETRPPRRAPKLRVIK